jgi:peptidoglycan biosynthesis protein MviN/MurJ (putative lipid II flippase)
MEDTKTPFFINIILNIINLFVAIYFFNNLSEEFKVAGLVIGYVISYLLTTPLLWVFLNRKGLNLKSRQLFIDALKPIFASFFMLIALFVIGNSFSLFDSTTTVSALVQVIIWGISGSIIYFVLSFIFKIKLITNYASKIFQ